MKKIIAFAIMFFAGSISAFAQTLATSASYNKSSQPALMLDLPYDEAISEDFIVANLKKTGYDAETKGKLFWKQNKLNGYYVFKDVRFADVKQPVDLYFKVERKGRKKNDESVIYLLVTKGDENFISSDSDEEVYNAAKKFMNGFVEKSAAFKLDLDIKAQEDQVKSAEKKLAKLEDNEKELLKKIKDLEEDVKKNKKDQEDQQKTIEDEKRKLEDLKKARN